MTRHKFTVDLKCPNCGQLGGVVWEENTDISPDGPQSGLIAVSGEFHQETDRAKYGGPVIICTRCDEIQPD